MEKARKMGTFKNFVAPRASNATVVNAFEKHSAVLRYLDAIDIFSFLWIQCCCYLGWG
jgi:hypothetical protein